MRQQSWLIGSSYFFLIYSFEKSVERCPFAFFVSLCSLPLFLLSESPQSLPGVSQSLPGASPAPPRGTPGVPPGYPRCSPGYPFTRKKQCMSLKINTISREVCIWEASQMHTPQLITRFSEQSAGRGSKIRPWNHLRVSPEYQDDPRATSG